MKSTGNHKIYIAFGLTFFAFILLVLWLFKPQPPLPHPQSNNNATAATPPQAMNTDVVMPTNNNGLTAHGPLPTLAASLQGTEIDCPLEVDKQGKLVLNIGIRSCFDYFLSSIGENTEAQLIADIRLYLSSMLPATASPYGIKLLDQYIAYKHALMTLQPAQQAKSLTAESYQKMIDAMQNLQRQFFNREEIAAFFGNEQSFNQFNVDQLRINEDKTLTAQQKAAKTAALIDQLPATLADSIRPSMQYAALQQLTQEINARGGSPAELRAMRESLVGAAAADRLEEVDRDEASWKSEVNNYLSAREQIKNSGLDDTGKQQAIDALRNRTFSSNEERLRAQTFEMMNDARK